MRHTKKVSFALTTEDDGSPGDLTITWPVIGEKKRVHTLIVPSEGDKASLDGQKFTIERLELPELVAPLIIRQLGAARPASGYT